MSEPTAIILDSSLELKNKELAQYLNNLSNLSKHAVKTNWEMCKIIHDIMKKGIFRQDFGTQDRFAAFIGMSPSSVSKMSRCYQYYEKICEGHPELNEKTPSFVYELLTVPLDQVNEVIDLLQLTSGSTTAEVRHRLKLVSEKTFGLPDQQRPQTAGAITQRKQKNLKASYYPQEMLQAMLDQLEAQEGSEKIHTYITTSNKYTVKYYSNGMISSIRKDDKSIYLDENYQHLSK